MKSILRVKFKEIRNGLELCEDNVFHLLQPFIYNKMIIAIFYPLKGELDCLKVGYRLEKYFQIKLALPVIRHKDSILEFSLFNQESKLKKGLYQIYEPDQQVICQPNIVIVPLLAFDPITKHRLGYGGGYYDKLIYFYRQQQIDCKFIGLAHECLSYQNLPFDDMDQKLDYIITNDRLI